MITMKYIDVLCEAEPRYILSQGGPVPSHLSLEPGREISWMVAAMFVLMFLLLGIGFAYAAAPHIPARVQCRDGGIYGRDAGGDWTALIPKLPFDANDDDPVIAMQRSRSDEALTFVVGTPGRIMRYIAGRAAWAAALVRGEAFRPRSFDRRESANGPAALYCIADATLPNGTNGSEVWKSFDGGACWMKTRVLAKAADANLSAIPYHFGGKKELYLAAARKIQDSIKEAAKPKLVG